MLWHILTSLALMWEIWVWVWLATYFLYLPTFPVIKMAKKGKKADYCWHHTPGIPKLFVSLDLKYLLEVPTEILSEYFSDLMTQAHFLGSLMLVYGHTGVSGAKSNWIGRMIIFLLLWTSNFNYKKWRPKIYYCCESQLYSNEKWIFDDLFYIQSYKTNIYCLKVSMKQKLP